MYPCRYAIEIHCLRSLHFCLAEKENLDPLYTFSSLYTVLGDGIPNMEDMLRHMGANSLKIDVPPHTYRCEHVSSALRLTKSNFIEDDKRGSPSETVPRIDFPSLKGPSPSILLHV